MTLHHIEHQLSEQEYLEGELTSDSKHELIDGKIYAMGGASRNHERIATNIIRQFGNHVQSSMCEVYSSDMKIKVGKNFFYPDAMVVCEDEEGDDYFTQRPIIIVEVLSKTTRRRDESTKRAAYQSLGSLQEYVLIEQDFVDIEVCRRSKSWASTRYYLNEAIHFESIDLTLFVEEIYERVQNDDMAAFLKQNRTNL